MDNRRRTVPQQVIGVYFCDARQNEGHHAEKHQHAEIQFTFGIKARRVVEIEPVRTEQDQNCNSQDLVETVVVVERIVGVFAKYQDCPEQKGGDDNQGLSDQQDQSADWDIDIEEPDQLCLGSTSSRY